MTELQFAATLVIVLGALPVYILAMWIERKKQYSLFAGWEPERISDQDACGRLYCKSLKWSAGALALICIPLFFNYDNALVLGISICVFPIIPLIWAMIYARKNYLS